MHISFPGGSVVRTRQPMQGMWVCSLAREDPLEEEMATHSSVLAWRIPWAEEPGRLQSTGSQTIRHTERLNDSNTCTQHRSWLRSQNEQAMVGWISAVSSRAGRRMVGPAWWGYHGTSHTLHHTGKPYGPFCILYSHSTRLHSFSCSEQAVSPLLRKKSE